MKISEISHVVGGELLLNSLDVSVDHLLIDSRKIFAPDHTLFFALKGERHDGHDFIERLIKKGLKNFIVSKGHEKQWQHLPINLIVVENTLKALQRLSGFHRQQFNIPVIGITGSNGKTIVKEWLWQLLSVDKSAIKSPKSFNSQVGVPLSVWQMNEHHKIGVFEAGISMPEEMIHLERVLNPNIGILTNVREAHLENFEDRSEIAKEKLKLFKNAETLIYCSDYRFVQKELDKNPDYANLNKLSWSYTGMGRLQIESVEKSNRESHIKGNYNSLPVDIVIPFQDDASIENAIHCWLTLLYLDYSPEEIKSRMKNLTGIAMRLEVKQGIGNALIVNDSYNNDITSLHIALDFLNQQKPQNKNVLILSDIEQSGRDEKELYTTVAELIKNKGINMFVGIGEHVSNFSELYQVEKFMFNNTNDFLQNINSLDFKNSSILLKGARRFEFEKISDRLQQKAHETVLEVNLSALVNNFNYFKSHLNPNCKIMAMVKAASYGAGNFEIARALEYNKVDYLGVAYPDEGIALKQEGISLPIMVMNPEVSAFDAMIRYDLQPEIYSFRTFQLFLDELLGNNYFLEKGRPYPIHLKIDTGMHRLGFEEKDVPKLIELISKHQGKVKVETVFSHLAASDSKKHDDFTNHQLEIFDRICNVLSQSLNYRFDRHILNSAGILRFPDAHYDMVRLGIGMYGMIGDEKHLGRLSSVTRLKTVVSQIKQIKKGETVGYNQNYVMPKDGYIATIPVGYADGLDRRLGNGNWLVKINGQQAPIIGNICMDMCMVDVTGVAVEEEDAVYIFESQQELMEIAKRLDTITYEVLTSISGRVKRIFYEE